MSQGLFERTGVRYEVACDLIGAVIAHYAETIAVLRDQPAPDQDAIAKAEAAKGALLDERDALDPENAQAIEEAIAKYGEQARNLYRP